MTVFKKAQNELFETVSIALGTMKRKISKLVALLCFAIPIVLSCVPITYLVRKLISEWRHINEFTLMVSAALIIAIVVCGVTGLAIGVLVFSLFRLILKVARRRSTRKCRVFLRSREKLCFQRSSNNYQ